MSRDRYVMSSAQSKSISEACREASSFLAERGVAEPESNANLLIRYVLGLEGAAYYVALRDPFPPAQLELWEEVITRKAEGEPAQYIIGEQDFYGLSFKVTPAVLIPRPETELLVEAVVEEGRKLWSAEHTPSVADIGTGSGAIALTLKHLCPSWNIAASDISPSALELAQNNARRLQLSVTFRQGDLLEPFAGERLDIVVSNPPYIPALDIEGLQPEVRDYEPRLALDGGVDGLAPYRIMMKQLELLSSPPRVIGFELGMGQAGDVAGLLQSAGHWRTVRIVPDLAGIERHVIGVE